MNLKVRMRNPIFWVQIVGVFLTTALAYNSMKPCDLTTWQGLLELLMGVVTNPYLLATCGISVWSAINDPTTSGVTDSHRALAYKEPFKDKEEA